MSKSIAIILAAGSGKRLGFNIPKQFLKINDKEILAYTLESFEKSDIDEIIVVASEDYIEKIFEIADLYNIDKLNLVVLGGKERYNSVYNALSYGEFEPDTKVLIHDSARALISIEKINEIIKALDIEASVVPAVKPKDTIREVLPDRYYAGSLDRDKLAIIQTPQGFYYKEIKLAYDKLMLSDELQVGITDDAMVLERVLNKKAKFIEGEYTNIKITTKEDLLVAKAFLEDRYKGDSDE